MSAIMIHGTRRAATAHVRYVVPVSVPAAQGLVGRVYTQIEDDFGMLAPPLALHSPSPRMLAACWLLLRETLLVRGVVRRHVKEVIATAVSLGNACPYCVDVHGSTLHGLLPSRQAAALAGGAFDQVADPELRQLARWARSSGEPASARVPGPAQDRPETVGVMVVFQYINRMVNLFLTASPFPPGLTDNSRAVARRVFGRMLRTATRNHPTPGEGLDHLPAAPLPADLAWAVSNPSIASAFARAAAAIDEAGQRCVPDAVRELVQQRIAAWDGQPVGLSRAWLAEAVTELSTADRPIARFCLLASLASHQVIQADIDALRAIGVADATLIELAAWASFTVARRIGTWSG